MRRARLWSSPLVLKFRGQLARHEEEKAMPILTDIEEYAMEVG